MLSVLTVLPLLVLPLLVLSSLGLSALGLSELRRPDERCQPEVVDLAELAPHHVALRTRSVTQTIFEDAEQFARAAPARAHQVDMAEALLVDPVARGQFREDGLVRVPDPGLLAP